MTAGTAWTFLLRSLPKGTGAYAGAATATTVGMASLLDMNSLPTTTRPAICEAKATTATTTKSSSTKLQRKMSSAGRLSLYAETKENPFNPTLLVALVGKPFDKHDFEQLWNQREMPSRHPRFHQKVKSSSSSKTKTMKEEKETIVGGSSGGVFVPTQLPLESHIKETAFPKIYHLELQERIQTLLQVPLQVQNLLWQVEISPGGPLGQSGAIAKDRAAELVMEYTQRGDAEPKESLLLFRGHGALADGVSLAAAFMDLCDEAAELKQELEREIQNKRTQIKALRWWQRLTRLLHAIYYYTIGSWKAFSHYWKLYMSTPKNPFQQMKGLENTTTKGERSLSWARVATVQEAEQVAQSLTKDNNKPVTIQDVMISCVSAAVARQMQEHQMRYEMDQSSIRGNVKIPKHINVLVPVHPEGGRLKTGQAVGHRLGSFFAAVPSDLTMTAAQRLSQVHESLYPVQHTTPAVFWSRVGSQLVSSLLSASWATSLWQRAQPNVAFWVCTTRGPSRRIHWKGRAVQVQQSFTPLPPGGIPIGISISTYAGDVHLSVTAEPWAVPDAERFLSWILEEYKFLYTESPLALL